MAVLFSPVSADLLQPGEEERVAIVTKRKAAIMSGTNGVVLSQEGKKHTLPMGQDGDESRSKKSKSNVNKPKNSLMTESSNGDYYSDSKDEVKPPDYNMKLSAVTVNNKIKEEEKKDNNKDNPFCVHCARHPCVVEDDDASEEGSEIVDWLNENIKEGIPMPMRSFRFYLGRMYSRHLNHNKYSHCRQKLPLCVRDFIEAHFHDK